MLIAIKTLGCKVNQYETEMLKERFLKKGHQIVGEDDFADVYIINTCTVTSLADRKSRQYIRRMKKKNPKSLVAVTGCYSQVSPEEVAKIAEVDIVTGTSKKEELIERIEKYKAENNTNTQCMVEDYHSFLEYEETGVITSMESRTRAYIKIQEGCNRFCSYCIIPYARGQVRSRSKEDILKEAESLVQKGFKELILTGINTALYGTEGENSEEELSGIEGVISALEAMEGDFRVRLSSLEPTVINADYVKRLLKYKRLCPHLHLSIQSGSNNILQAMNRKYDRDEYLEIVKALRDFDKGYGITTDIIVGFPGETEEDFKDSLDMVEQAEFCRVHAFKYSKREGTKAAELKGHIAPEIKNRRSEELIRTGKKVSKQFFEACIGEKRRVLVEENLEETGYLTGYTENYIKAYIPQSKEIAEGSGNPLNDFVDVEVTGIYKDGVMCRTI